MPDAKQTSAFVDDYWERLIVPTLTDYIRIPNKSPNFDPDWKANGHMDRALELARQWTEANRPEGSVLKIYEEDNRTPLLLLTIPPSGIPADQARTVLMYGHLDKQPEMTGWRDGLGPWEPVLENGKLYGRGGADDGYALFASVCAVNALRESGTPHDRIVVLIEFSEESGSPDLPFYTELLADEIGAPDLVVCLDSGVGNYDQFWTTTSLRGMLAGVLSVQVLEEGVHSGDASGIIPSSFRLLGILLSRLEEQATGRVLPPALNANIPAVRVEQARAAAAALDHEVYTKFPMPAGMRPMHDDNAELILNRTWRAALSYTGLDGMPLPGDAGNVLRPRTELKLSLRLPPVIEAPPVQDLLAELFLKDPPLGAKVEYRPGYATTGWNAPDLSVGLETSLQNASAKYFGKPALAMGEGGSIPFMGMLGDKFPQAQFVVTGVLGPASNAHGPNEFLHIPYAKTLTCCVAEVLGERGYVSR